MLRGRCQQRRVSIRACLQCYAHGCPCSMALLWVGRWHSTRGILRCLSSPWRFPYLIAQSQVSLALGGSSLLRAAVQLPSNHLDTSWWTKSVPIAHPAGPAGRRGLQEGDGPCRDEELLAPILGLIFVSLPFVLLLSGLQRMLYVRSSSPWQKPALKDWDYNKVVQLSVWTHPARSSQQFTTCINLSRIQGSRAFEFSMGNSHPFI